MTATPKSETRNRKPATCPRPQTGVGNILVFLCFLLSFFCLPSSAYAACTSPAGNAGALLYNSAYHVYQFCNGTTWNALGPTPGAGPSNSNTVFVTSTTYNGTMGAGGTGVAGANADCAARATAAGLSGTFKAWVAVTTGTDDPATTFTQSSVPYKDVLGTTIANNWAGLTSGTLLAGISLNELGAAVTAGTNVWTNVNTDGTAKNSGSSSTYNCTGWSNGTAQHGNDGLTGSATSTWTVTGASDLCSTANRLYCFQQDGGSGCLSPAGNEADMIYNYASHVYQYCDGAVWHAMGPVPGTGSSGTGSNTVFVSSTTHNGAYITVAAADTICQNLATAVPLAGTYKAWLAISTGVDDPATRFTHSAIPYKDVGGTTIANNWAGLISGTLLNAIKLNEDGLVISGVNVWTNVASNGTAKVSGSNGFDNCAGWTNGTLGDSGNQGLTGSSTSTWTDNLFEATNCTGSSHLYCFQQDGTAGGCTSPAGNEADMIYNNTSNVLQYCDGAVWRQMQ